MLLRVNRFMAVLFVVLGVALLIETVARWMAAPSAT